MKPTVVIALLAFGVGASIAAAQQPAHASGRARAYAALARLPDWSGTWTIVKESSDHLQDAVYTDKPGASTPRLRPAYQQQVDAGGKDGLPDDSNSLHCLPGGMPEMMYIPSPLGYEFLFTPGRITLIAEEGEVRRIYTDGRAHDADADETYQGESIGHWQGSTLVVDTTSISPKAQLLYAVVHSERPTHVVERMHVNAHGHLQIDTVVESPTVLSEPWHYSIEYERSRTAFAEYVCGDDNRDAHGQPDLTPPPPPP